MLNVCNDVLMILLCEREEKELFKFVVKKCKFVREVNGIICKELFIFIWGYDNN